MDDVFKALADGTRRGLLDALHDRNGQTLSELCATSAMSRQAVTKHLTILERARLIVTRREGRQKRHFLNVAPIGDISDRWISRYDRSRVAALTDLKHALEEPTVNDTSFVYVTYIKTTPQRLWQALTDPAFIAMYFDGTGPRSDWRTGSGVEWRVEPDGPYYDWGQRIVEAIPEQRLSYTWHGFENELRQFIPDVTDEEFERMRREPRSTVTFDIEPAGETTKLTVTHDGFAPGSQMLESVSGGWPAILSSLKSVLETGEALSLE